MEFDELAERPDAEIDLGAAALLVARDEYPSLDVAHYLGRLDVLASEIRSRTGGSADAVEVIFAMNQYLFVEQDFAGNVEDYSDPRNSYLNDVLDRRLGIPISLSVLYIEVGARLDVTFQGISFPGHFLVKCPYRDGDIVLDPFFKGVSLGEEELLKRVSDAAGGAGDPRELLGYFLTATSKRDILARMLRNLRIIFMQTGREERALQASNRICALAPNDPQELRSRGGLLEKLECFRPALADYTRYLELAPGAEDAADIRARVMELKTQVARIS